MINDQQANELLTRRARVRVGDAQKFGTFVEGEVIGYSRVPMILVRTDEGEQAWWNVELPITEVRAEPEVADEWAVRTTLPDGTVHRFDIAGLLNEETARAMAAHLNGKVGVRSEAIRRRFVDEVARP